MKNLLTNLAVGAMVLAVSFCIGAILTRLYLGDQRDPATITIEEFLSQFNNYPVDQPMEVSNIQGTLIWKPNPNWNGEDPLGTISQQPQFIDDPEHWDRDIQSMPPMAE